MLGVPSHRVSRYPHNSSSGLFFGLPPDYELFGRSFDGLDMRFMKPLREKRPKDFEVVKQWCPFIEADEKRWSHYGL